MGGVKRSDGIGGPQGPDAAGPVGGEGEGGHDAGATIEGGKAALPSKRALSTGINVGLLEQQLQAKLGASAAPTKAASSLVAGAGAPPNRYADAVAELKNPRPTAEDNERLFE